MRNWDNLSDYEFEAVAGDLLGAELGVRFERFASGPDGGIDLRSIGTDGQPHIVQCKHYKGSAWSDLLKAVRREAKRLPTMDPAPASYRLVTSQGLTPKRKTKLAETLAPFVTREDQVYGRDDLEALLDRHEEVERRQVKLWLTSGSQLDALLRPGVHLRSKILAERIKHTLPLYVQADSFFDALEILQERRVCLIAGPPGIGKTTLGQMLVAEALGRGYEPIEVSEDVNEAWDTFDPRSRQIFFYDDFLGQTVFGELRKNEEGRLLTLMRAIERSRNTMFVLTTREYILQHAAQMYESLGRAGLTRDRFLLELPRYSRLDRARILHNHVWHSDALGSTAMDALSADRGYRRIVDHPNFNPRVIEYVTGLQRAHRIEFSTGERWLDFAESALNRPTEVWRSAFERQVGGSAQALLLTLATFSTEVEIRDLRTAFEGYCDEAGVRVSPGSFRSALEVLDDSFVATVVREDGTTFVRAIDPGLQDFVQSELLDHSGALRSAVRGAQFFEQLMHVWRLVEDIPGPAREAVVRDDAFARSAERLIDARSARWAQVQDIQGFRWARSGPQRETRADRLARITVCGEPPVGVAEVALAALKRLMAKWERGEIDAFAAVMMNEPADRGIPIARSAWIDALKGAISHDPGSLEEWEAVVQLQDDRPETFDADDWKDLGQRFLYAATETLRYSDTIETEEDIERWLGAAEEFGVVVDKRHIDAAYQELHYGDEEDDDRDRRQLSRADTHAVANEDVEIDALFSPRD